MRWTLKNFNIHSLYHLGWHVVRNNSPRIIFDWLTGENCRSKNGLGHIVCHERWHIRGSGSFSLDDKFRVQRRHKGCFPSSKGLKPRAWKLKAAKWLKTAREIAQCVTCVFSESCALTAPHVMFSAKIKKKGETEQIPFATQMWLTAFKALFKNISPKPEF